MDSLEKRRINVYVILGFQIFVGLLSKKHLVSSLHIRILNKSKAPIWGEYLAPCKGRALTLWLQYISLLPLALWGL